jgi:hypothetical protein
MIGSLFFLTQKQKSFMKKKHASQKLTLKKLTLQSMNNVAQLRMVQGGILTETPSCENCISVQYSNCAACDYSITRSIVPTDCATQANCPAGRTSNC